MNMFFSRIPWDTYIVLNIVGSIIFILIVWTAICYLNIAIDKITRFRKTYPPEISRTLIRTYIPKNDNCPLTIWEKTKRIVCGDETNEYKHVLYEFSFADDPNNQLEISSQFCEPSSDIDGLYQVVHAWPKTKLSWLRPDHPRGNSHFIFPETWIKEAKKKVRNVTDKIS